MSKLTCKQSIYRHPYQAGVLCVFETTGNVSLHYLHKTDEIITYYY